MYMCLPSGGEPCGHRLLGGQRVHCQFLTTQDRPDVIVQDIDGSVVTPNSVHELVVCLLLIVGDLLEVGIGEDVFDVGPPLVAILFHSVKEKVLASCAGSSIRVEQLDDLLRRDNVAEVSRRFPAR